MDGVVIEPSATSAAQMEAARIWARATDARDTRSVPADPIAKLDGIQQRLALPGATLHLARRSEVAEGFVLLVPHGPELELVYLAVDPAAWGRQTASALLTHVVSHATELGAATIDLWVLADNQRAISTYERAGWTLTSEEKTSGGRRERRMVRVSDGGARGEIRASRATGA